MGPRAWQGGLATWALVAGLAGAAPAQAQFNLVPSPTPAGLSEAQSHTLEHFRHEVARHVYQRYPLQVFKGRLPPLLYAVLVIEARIGRDGQLLNVRVTREPAAAKEVSAWVLGLLHKASPFPAPRQVVDPASLDEAGAVTLVETWLVDRSGRFQVHSLSEGQISSPPGV